MSRAVKYSSMKNHKTTKAQDKALFSMAVRLLWPYVAFAGRLPLYYTLPNGRSIEALCVRLRDTTGPIPSDVEQTICYLAKQLAVWSPDLPNYHTYSVLLNEIALRLTLPFDQRQAPIRYLRDRLSPDFAA